MNKTTKSFNTLISIFLASSILLGASPNKISVSEKTSNSLNEIAHNKILEPLADTSSFKQGTVNCLILNVRSGSSTKQKIVTRIKKNDKVTVLESNKNGWSKIKTTKNITGWVYTKYLKITTVKVNNVKVTSNIQITTTSKETQEKNSIIDSIIKKEGSIKSTELNTLKSNLKKLPLSLLSEVQKQKINVVITSKDVKNYYKYSFSGTMTGLFDPMVNKIYISSKESHINKSTIHEFGHALDLILGEDNYISLSKEWDAIYKSENKTASFSYYRANAQEYFADSFNRYINNSKTLKSKAPKTYNFIDSAIKKL